MKRGKVFILFGAPGSGKSQACDLLKENLKGKIESYPRIN